jgi:anti-sigma28 factor (negative regulator of flagellin synthesis)
MRIEENYLGPQGRVKTGEASPVARSESGSVRGGGKTGDDSVSLSDLTTLLAHISGKADDSRTEQIARIASEYRAGRYVVDAGTLADGLIDRAFEG